MIFKGEKFWVAYGKLSSSSIGSVWACIDSMAVECATNLCFVMSLLCIRMMRSFPSCRSSSVKLVLLDFSLKKKDSHHVKLLAFLARTKVPVPLVLPDQDCVSQSVDCSP